jgi:hypothetical protein
LIEIVRRAPTESGLKRIAVTVDETIGDVRVRAVQASGGTDAAFRTDVTLHVPHDARLALVRVLEGAVTLTALRAAMNVEVRRGPIKATDVAGSVRLQSEIGDVIADQARLTEGGLLRLRTFNGDVKLALAERPANARVMALALNGSIVSDLPLTMKDRWGPRWGEATLGSGEPVISLDVVTGKIEIRTP